MGKLRIIFSRCPKNGHAREFLENISHNAWKKFTSLKIFMLPKKFQADICVEYLSFLLKILGTQQILFSEIFTRFFSLGKIRRFWKFYPARESYKGWFVFISAQKNWALSDTWNFLAFWEFYSAGYLRAPYECGRKFSFLPNHFAHSGNNLMLENIWAVWKNFCLIISGRLQRPYKLLPTIPSVLSHESQSVWMLGRTTLESSCEHEVVF